MTPYEDVLAFHHKFAHPAPRVPVVLADDVMRSRVDRIGEECEELEVALLKGNLGEIAHECVDVIYVALGTLVATGLPLQPFWDAVHAANMAKEPHPNGPLGKPVKPEGWEKADCGAIVLDLIGGAL